MAPKHTTKRVSLFGSAARTADENGSAVSTIFRVISPAGGSNDMSGYTTGALLFLDVTAVSGVSPTLAVKLQGRSTPGTGTWIDVVGGAFGSKTAVSGETIRIAGPLPPEIRAVATLGGTTPNFTFSTIGILGD